MCCSVIYSYKDENGNKKQKWETYNTKREAEKRKVEIEALTNMNNIVVPKCKTLNELLDEYINLYGKDIWDLSTYDGNISLINNYIRPIIGESKLLNGK